MKAREFVKEIHLTLTLKEFDELGHLLGGWNPELLESDVLDGIYQKMQELKKRLDFEIPPSQGGSN